MATSRPIDRSKTPLSSKGVLADLANPNNRLVFQYNPPEIRDEKTIAWPECQIPGADDALAQFGSGASLKLDLSLFFNTLGEVSPSGYDTYVEDQLRFLHSFTETRRTVDPYAGKSPGLLIFIFGSVVFGTGSSYHASLGAPGMVVRIANLATTRRFFHRGDLRSRRAVADISLVRHVRFPR